MLSWLSKLTPEGQLGGACQRTEQALEALAIEWIQADHGTRLAAGQFVGEALCKLIPGYDLSRNIHVQFFAFVRDKPPAILVEGAKQFSEMAATARVENRALYISMGTLGQLLSLFAINASTKRNQTRQKAGSLFTAHSRTANDMIQYWLYHTALAQRA